MAPLTADEIAASLPEGELDAFLALERARQRAAMAALLSDCHVETSPGDGDMLRPMASVRMKLREALQAIGAAHEVVTVMGERTTGRTSERYFNLGGKLVAEAASVHRQISREVASTLYSMGAALRGSAGQLRTTYEQAQRMIRDLNLAADLIRLFGKLVAAI